MTSLFNKALLGFVLIFFYLPAYSDYSPSRETVRFIFLYHSQFATTPELRNSLSFKILEKIHSLECVTPQLISELSLKHKSPRLFLNSLINHINNSCLSTDHLNNKKMSINSLNDYDLYILFSSEWGQSMASSMGHIRLAFMKSDAFMFDPIFTFSAYNFYSQTTGTATFSNYIDAAINSVDGKYTQSFFFDSYHETVTNESRKIHRFKVNTPLNLDDIYQELLLASKDSRDYNFFTKNCSSEALSFINKKSGNNKPIRSFTPPSKHLAQLLNNKTINYVDSFEPNSKDISTINEIDNVIYNNISSFSFSSNRDVTFSLYKSPRPLNGYSDFFSDTEILKFETNKKIEDYSLSIFKKSVIAPINKKVISYYFDLGHNIDSKFYMGVGNVINRYAFSSMLGYSEDLEWSSFNTAIASFNKIDLAINYSANLNSEILSGNINLYPSTHFKISLNATHSSNEVEIHYLF